MKIIKITRKKERIERVKILLGKLNFLKEVAA